MKFVIDILNGHDASQDAASIDNVLYPAEKSTIAIQAAGITGAGDGVVTVKTKVGSLVCNTQQITIDADDVHTIHISELFEKVEVSYTANGNTAGTIDAKLLRGRN